MTVTVVSDPLDASAALLPGVPAYGGAGSGGAVGGAGHGSSVSIGPLSGGSGYGISNAAAGAAAVAAARSPYLDWPVRRAAILREFSVSGTLHLSASFLANEDGGAGAAVDEAAGEEVSVPLAKARQRLEALEAAARGAHTVEMSQAEYLRRIERLHRALQNAWDSNHRVAALKIAIQCAKLLGEHRVPRFYPSMFALVTEILDTFGRLVFERLKAIADEEHKRLGGKGPLPDAFIAADVGAEARETCRNWMYKTACIRELLPRLYIEMALLECYRFIFDADFSSILMRLVHSLRGVGNPLVAAYGRLYLSRMAARLVRDDNKQRESSSVAIADFFATYTAVVASPQRLASMEALGISRDGYLHLYAPALAWQMHQLGWGAGRDVLASVLRMYAEQCGSSEALQPVIEAFHPSLYAPNAEALDHMLGLIREANPSTVTRADLYRSLMSQCALCGVLPAPACRAALLADASAAFATVAEPGAFARNAAALLELALAGCWGEGEALAVLSELVARMRRSAIATGATVSAPPAGGAGGAGGKDGAAGGAGAAASASSAPTPSSSSAIATYTAPPAAVPHLERVLALIVEAEARRAGVSSAAIAAAATGGAVAAAAAAAVASSSESAAAAAASALAAERERDKGIKPHVWSPVLSSEHVPALLDLLPAGNKPPLCRALLASLTAVPGPIADPVVVSMMAEVARVCHDALDVLSPESETRAVGGLIASFVAKIDLGRDLERQLALYADCRRAFPNLDAVKATLCAAGNDLSMKALRLVKGRHTPRTAEFVKAALAFVTITIPGVDDPFARMRLAMGGADAALRNGCVGQADMLLRAFITEVPDLHASLSLASGVASLAGGPSAAASAGSGSSAAVDGRLLEQLLAFARAAVPMPGHPDQGGMYLARGLLNAVQRYAWHEPLYSQHRWAALGAVVGLVHALTRSPLPCEPIPGVMGNDVLYAGDASYRADATSVLGAALATLVGAAEESAAAAASGDSRAKDTLLATLPQLLRARAGAVLDVDTSAATTGPLEKLCLALRAVDASHGALTETIALVSKRLREKAEKAAAATGAA